MIEIPHVIGLVPTILLPLTLISVLVTTIATYIAGLFGVQLKAEGPKRLLELLLKPRLLITAVVLNVLVVGAVKYVRYAKHYPERLSTIEDVQRGLATPSDLHYPNSTHSHLQTTQPARLADATDIDIQVAWTVTLPNGSFREPTLSGEHLFLGNDDGHIYEMSTNDGSTIRRFFVGKELTPNPFIWNNRIYTGEGIHYTHHARVYAFDLETGDFIGAFPTKGHTEGQPIVASHEGQNLLFGVAGKDGVFAIDPISMTQVWHQVHGHVDGSVRVADGRVFVGSAVEKGDKKSAKPTLTAYRFTDGEVLWQNSISASSWTAPIVTTNVVYVALGEIYDETSFGQLVGYDSASGKTVLEISVGAPMSSPPIQVGNRIYVSDRKEQINCFDLETESCLWTSPTVLRDDQTSVAGVSYDPFRNVLLYPSFTNGLYILDPVRGETVAHWMPDESMPQWRDTYAAVTVTKDAWYITDVKGTVRRLNPTLK